jgi:hypothetical protein
MKRNAAYVAALDLVPVVLALVLVGGLVYSLVSLLFVGHPDIGWSEHVMADAKAIARGHFPYGDPGTGYVGMLYTPLFPSLVAVLLKVTWWEGWGPIVSMLAVGATLVVLGRFAWRRGDDRSATWSRVAMVVALPLSAFTVFTTNGVFEGRTDQLAWCFFVVAAVRVLDDVLCETDPEAGRRGVRGRMVTGLLLALSVLTKQTTLAACGVVAVIAAVAWWLTLPADGGSGRQRRVPFEGLTLVAVVGVVLVALQLASDGFAFDLLFGVPRRQARVASVRTTLETDLKLLVVPIVLLLAGLVVAFVAARRHDAPAGAGSETPWWRTRPALGVAAAVIIAGSTVPGIVLAQTKQGGDFNALVGPVWGMALILAATLLAMPLDWSRTTVRAFGAALLVVSVLPLASTHDTLRRFDGRALGAPSLDLTRDWQTVPHDLVAAVDHDATVFDWAYPSYSVAASGPSYPGGGAPPDLAAAGYSPRWIVRDLLDGRWDRVRLYPTAPGEPLGIIDIYASGYGRRDTAWAWKINELIKLGYTPVENARGSETFYTPGPRLADVQYLAHCFGPYQAGALSIRVRDGGGLWCAGSTSLRLVDGPNPTSELVFDTNQPATFDINVANPSGVHLACLPELPSRPVVIRVHLRPGGRGVCDGAVYTDTAEGAVVTDVTIASGSGSLVFDVNAHVFLDGFKSGGRIVANLQVHNPKPSEL